MEQLSEKEDTNDVKRQEKASKKREFLEVFLSCFYAKQLLFCLMCVTKVNKNEKGVEAATPTPPIKTNQHFA